MYTVYGGTKKSSEAVAPAPEGLKLRLDALI
jgi:hypothetical protein